MPLTTDFGKRWYIVQTYSGYENAVKQDIERRAETMGLKEFIFQILVPEEVKITKKNDGTEKKIIKQIYPGYVFIEMIVTDESWFMVRNTPKVTGFLGSSGGGTKPVPLQDEEIKSILYKLGIISKPSFDYLLNKTVEIMDDSFKNYRGTVVAVDADKQEALVNIIIFGRPNPKEVAIKDLKIINNDNNNDNENSEPTQNNNE